MIDIEKLAEKWDVDDDCLQKGYEDERKEHPEFTDEQVAMIARDHLKMDKEYYGEETEDDSEETDYKSAKKAVYKSGKGED